MSHHCHAIGCAKNVPPKLLMCLWHWRMVEPQLQRLVWRTYVPGQEVRKDPTELYLVVQAAAVAYVATQGDHVWTPEQGRDHVLGAVDWSELTVADLDLLAKYLPDVFGDYAREIRRIRESAS